MNRKKIYWTAQIGGWGIFVLGLTISYILQGTLLPQIWIGSAIILLFGPLISHFFRTQLYKRNWNYSKILGLIPRVVVASLTMGLLLYLVFGGIIDILAPAQDAVLDFSTPSFIAPVLNFSVLFLIWNLIYFTVHIVENFKASQIRNLELTAAKTEIELTSFKNQLNPHFLFNALNSIRALVDENPEKAKKAVTMLSRVLRRFLSQGKRSFIPFKEELELIENYMAIEKIRFEERLEFNSDIEKETLDISVPPLMIQTLVENAIKHGIGKRMKGGKLKLRARMKQNNLEIRVTNCGTLGGENKSGIGLNNTRKRLDLLYGGRADFELRESSGEVSATLILPKSI